MRLWRKEIVEEGDCGGRRLWRKEVLEDVGGGCGGHRWWL